jgi:hypothetical protein
LFQVVILSAAKDPRISFLPLLLQLSLLFAVVVAFAVVVVVVVAIAVAPFKSSS